MSRRLAQPRSLLAGALLGAGVLLGGAAAGAGKVTEVVSGTAHQAVFGIAIQGDVGVAVGAAGAILESGKKERKQPI